MPTYIITNTDTNETTEKFCSWNELGTFLEVNPNFKIELTTPKIISVLKERLRK